MLHVALCNVEGNHQIGSRVGHVGRCGVEFYLNDGCKGVTSLLVIAQVGTDEHQGHETAAHVGLADANIAIMADPVEDGSVLPSILVGGFSVQTVAEDFQQPLFDIGDEVATDDIVDLFLHSYLIFTEARKLQTLHAAKHVDAQCETDAIGGVEDVNDIGCVALEETGVDGDQVVMDGSVNGETKGEADALFAKYLDERPHEVLRNSNGPPLSVAVVAKSHSSLRVPWALKQLADALLCRADENEVVEVVAQTVVFILQQDTSIVLHPILLTHGDAAEEAERNEIFIEQPLTVVCTDIFFLQPTLDALRIEVSHHIPADCLPF